MNLSKQEFLNCSDSAIYTCDAQKAETREKLNADVEKWLAKNRIKELPAGFTHFPDGNIPVSKNRVDTSESARLEREKKIAERNELVRKEREALKKAKAEQLEISKRLKAQQKAEERKLKATQKAAEKLAVRQAKEVLKKAKALKKAFPLKLVKFPVWSERYARIQINNMRKVEASQKGSKGFTGVCAKHGETNFTIWKNSFRCIKCTNLSRRVTEHHPEFLRRKKNGELRDKALSEGVFEFIGDCKHHGEVKFSISGHENRHRCTVCRSEVKLDRKEINRTDPRIAFNRIARNEAIKNNQAVFIGECLNHGKTDFKVNSITKYSYCVECRRETQRKNHKARNQHKPMSDRLVRSQFNQQKRDEALSLGRKDFTGQCHKHGSTRFVMFKGAKGVDAYKCRACKNEINQKSLETRKDAYSQNPNNIAVRDYFKTAGRGKLIQVALALGISKSLLSNYINARSPVSDERYEQFKQVVGLTEQGVAA